MGRIWVLLVGVMVVGCASSGPPAEENPNRFDARSPADCLAATDCNRTMVCAHRGFKLHAPENTLASIQDAIDLGVDFVEFDVRETADDHLVLMHDSTVDRTTDGVGSVSQLTLAEVQALTILQAEGEERPDGAFVPTLEEVLALTVGHVVADIDMKTDRADLLGPVLIAAGAVDHVVVHKSNAGIADTLSAAAPELRIMPSIKDADALAAWSKDHPTWIVETDGDLAGNVPEGLVPAAHEVDIKVFHDVLGLPDVAAYLSHDPQYWKASAKAGADVLQTDFPDALLPYLDDIGYR